jgi:hypothetical protein
MTIGQLPDVCSRDYAVTVVFLWKMCFLLGLVLEVEDEDALMKRPRSGLGRLGSSQSAVSPLVPSLPNRFAP